MPLPRRRFLHIAAGAAALPVMSRFAWAQAYPARPITIVVPFPPGGPTDLLGRMVGERLRQSYGQTVVIENVVGANGSLGVGRVARAVPDGYTLLIGLWNTHVSNPAIYPLNYDVQSDFEPIALLSSIASMIVARKSLPADDLKGMIAWLKANPDKGTEGHVGIGSIGHVGGILFQNLTGTRFQHVPYRGSAPVMQALVAGQVDFGIESAVTSLPQFRAGAIKANNHCGADFDAIVEIDDVVIGHANAARRGRCADGMRLVGTVDAVLGVAEIQRARAEWIGGATVHMTWQIGPALEHFRRWGPIRPFALVGDGHRTAPCKTGATNANTVLHRLTFAGHQIEPSL